MADKMSTLILTVDLKCCRCDKKIRKVIAKCPEIQSQEFDEKNNKVKVSGPFDPEKLKRKLRCKACKYIIHIEIPKPKADDTKLDTKRAPPRPEPVLLVPVIPVVPFAPMVCCRPCCVGYPGHGRCTCFGKERGACDIIFFSEEDPSCTIM